MRKLVVLVTLLGVALLALPGVAAAAPETTIDSGPPATTTSTTAAFTFHSSGPRHTFRCSLDGAVFAACTTPKTYTGLAVGQHTFRVAGLNRKAVADPTPAAYIWTIQSNVPPPAPKQCANGLDDDGDGLIDLGDPGCTNATDDDESTVVQPPSPPGSNVTFPVRATFHYPWFPPTTFGRFHPVLGVYSDSDPATVDAHVRAMDWGKVDVSISSWWGQGKQSEQARIPLLMDRTTALGSRLKHSLYYEKEGFGNPSHAEITSDLDYIKARYAGRPEFARIDGQPVLFVYSADDTTCAVADKWSRLAGADFYLVLKVFAGFGSCVNQPDDWHQYGPASAVHTVGDSFAISPGFWHHAEANPRLKRELLYVAQPGTAPVADWDANVRAMVASTKHWHLVTTQTEWGEATAIAEATEWQTAEHGYYLDVLHTDAQGLRAPR
jgi:hypothetical protein